MSKQTLSTAINTQFWAHLLFQEQSINGEAFLWVQSSHFSSGLVAIGINTRQREININMIVW